MDFTVTPSTFEENLDKASFEHPKDYVLETGRQKGEEVFKRLKQQVFFSKKNLEQKTMLNY